MCASVGCDVGTGVGMNHWEEARYGVAMHRDSVHAGEWAHVEMVDRRGSGCTVALSSLLRAVLALSVGVSSIIRKEFTVALFSSSGRS